MYRRDPTITRELVYVMVEKIVIHCEQKCIIEYNFHDLGLQPYRKTVAAVDFLVNSLIVVFFGITRTIFENLSKFRSICTIIILIIFRITNFWRAKRRQEVI